MVGHVIMTMRDDIPEWSRDLYNRAIIVAADRGGAEVAIGEEDRTDGGGSKRCRRRIS